MATITRHAHAGSRLQARAASSRAWTVRPARRERGVKRIESSFKGLQRGFALLDARGSARFGVGFWLRVTIIRCDGRGREVLCAARERRRQQRRRRGQDGRRTGRDGDANCSTSRPSATRRSRTRRGCCSRSSRSAATTSTGPRRAVLDLATRLGKDLPSAALLVGKALEDPSRA